jgi:hypothetical protein
MTAGRLATSVNVGQGRGRNAAVIYSLLSQAVGKLESHGKVRGRSGEHGVPALRRREEEEAAGRDTASLALGFDVEQLFRIDASRDGQADKAA